MPLDTYLEAALVDVAMILIKLAPMASFIGRPKIKVKTGITINPPPIPNMDPIIPAAAAVIITSTMSIGSIG